jgi:hypothetical protein
VAAPADAFTADWIADGGRAFVDRYAPGIARAVGLVRAAGGVPVLAHPRSPGYEVPDEVIAALAGAGLGGIEVFHLDHDDSQRMRLTELARSLNLIMTGGSDGVRAAARPGLASAGGIIPLTRRRHGPRARAVRLKCPLILGLLFRAYLRKGSSKVVGINGSPGWSRRSAGRLWRRCESWKLGSSGCGLHVCRIGKPSPTTVSVRLGCQRPARRTRGSSATTKK